MNKPIILAYLADWKAAELPAAKVDYAKMTHIAHSFAVATNEGVTFPDVKASRELITTAHKKGVKVTLAIGGAESNRALSTLCQTVDGAKKLAASVAAHVQTIGYDGVDVDWEHPENRADAGRLSLFVAELRRVVPRPKLLTMAVPATDWSAKWHDAPALLPHLDWAAVMTYDFYGPWSGDAGHHAALFPTKASDPSLSGSAAIKYWRTVKKFPASKLLLGVSVYARGFRAKAWGDVVSNHADKEVERAYRDLGGVGKTDAATGTATWKAENGAVILSGDNPDTARQKGGWAKSQNLAGVFFWELSQDLDGDKSVIRAARRGYGAGR